MLTEGKERWTDEEIGAQGVEKIAFKKIEVVIVKGSLKNNDKCTYEEIPA